jgi:hypothetical protein
MNIALTALILSCCLLACTPKENHPLYGKWVSEPVNGSLGMFLTLSRTGTFVMGDAEGDKENLGISGTWTANKNRVVLKCKKTESCKVKEGQVIEFAYRMLGEKELEISQPGSRAGPRKFKRYSAAL